MTADALKSVLLITLVATAQVAIVDRFELVEGRASIVIPALAAIALLRGPIFGAASGFYAGLVLDVATLGALGLSSLLLTLAGYWAGRFGEATSDERHQAGRVLIAVALVTIGVTIGSLVAHLLLGESAQVGPLMVQVLLPSLLLNLVLALPAYALCRRLFPPPERRVRDVALA